VLVTCLTASVNHCCIFSFVIIVVCVQVTTTTSSGLNTRNSCWPTHVGKHKIGVCERHKNMLANCWRQIELVSILANCLPTCCCVVHTHPFELANTSFGGRRGIIVPHLFRHYSFCFSSDLFIIHLTFFTDFPYSLLRSAAIQILFDNFR